MKYAVNAGFSFAHKGVVIGPGAEATPEIFGAGKDGEDAFMRHLASGRIVPAPEPPAFAPADPPPLGAQESADGAPEPDKQATAAEATAEPAAPQTGGWTSPLSVPSAAGNISAAGAPDASGSLFGTEPGAGAFEATEKVKEAARAVVDAERALEAAEAELKTASGEAAKKDARDKIAELKKKVDAAKTAYEELGAE